MYVSLWNVLFNPLRFLPSTSYFLTQVGQCALDPSYHPSCGWHAVPHHHWHAPSPAHLEDPSLQALPYLLVLQVHQGLQAAHHVQAFLAFLQGGPWDLQSKEDTDMWTSISMWVTHLSLHQNLEDTCSSLRTPEKSHQLVPWTGWLLKTGPCDGAKDGFSHIVPGGPGSPLIPSLPSLPGRPWFPGVPGIPGLPAHTSVPLHLIPATTVKKRAKAKEHSDMATARVASPTGGKSYQPLCSMSMALLCPSAPHSCYTLQDPGTQ